VFGNVMGLSLGSPCTFRMRESKGEGGWRRVSLCLEPRSVYFLADSARWKWEHSIPPVEALRYSITFRNRRTGDSSAGAGPRGTPDGTAAADTLN
jgi:alkylated DNA repair dioxygenase AlkB